MWTPMARSDWGIDYRFLFSQHSMCENLHQSFLPRPITTNFSQWFCDLHIPIYYPWNDLIGKNPKSKDLAPFPHQLQQVTNNFLPLTKQPLHVWLCSRRHHPLEINSESYVPCLTPLQTWFTMERMSTCWIPSTKWNTLSHLMKLLLSLAFPYLYTSSIDHFPMSV